MEIFTHYYENEKLKENFKQSLFKNFRIYPFQQNFFLELYFLDKNNGIVQKFCSQKNHTFQKLNLKEAKTLKLKSSIYSARFF